MEVTANTFKTYSSAFGSSILSRSNNVFELLLFLVIKLLKNQGKLKDWSLD